MCGLHNIACTTLPFAYFVLFFSYFLFITCKNFIHMLISLHIMQHVKFMVSGVGLEKLIDSGRFPVPCVAKIWDATLYSLFSL